MKKLIIGFILNLVCGSLLAQYSFERHSVLIDWGTGVGIYKLTASSNGNSSSFIGGQFITPLDFEYGLTERIGVGLRIEPGFASNDSTKESFKSSNAGIKVYYHFLNFKRTTIFLSTGLNGASCKFNRPSDSTSIAGKGSNFQLGLGLRRYIWRETIGFFIKAEISNYSFTKWKNESKIKAINQAFLDNYKLKANGLHFSVGLAIQIKAFIK